MAGAERRKATIKDVAQQAGVSTATVERALKNVGRIKPETQKRVLDAIEALNYRANDVARALQNSRHFNILAVYHRTPEYFTVEFERGFRDAEIHLANRGLTITTARTKSLEPQDAIKVLKHADLSNVDAVLIDCGGSELDAPIAKIISQGIPVATFGSDSPSSGRSFYVGEDPYVSGQMAADVASKAVGPQGKYVVFRGPTSVYALNRRTEGFVSTMREYFPCVTMLPPIDHNDNDSLALNTAIRVLSDTCVPDCIFCNSAAGAIALNRAIIYLNLTGDRIPTIIGYDLNDEIYDMLQQGRCHCVIYQNPYQEAYNATNYMFELLCTGKVPTLRDLFSYSHVVFKHNTKLFIL